jgi:hypothetical protein
MQELYRLKNRSFTAASSVREGNCWFMNSASEDGRFDACGLCAGNGVKIAGLTPCQRLAHAFFGNRACASPSRAEPLAFALSRSFLALKFSAFAFVLSCLDFWVCIFTLIGFSHSVLSHSYFHAP